MKRMEKHEMNELIKHIKTIYQEMAKTSDTFVQEVYLQKFELLKTKYGSFFEDILFDIYDDYCADDEIMALEDYLSSSGVTVLTEDFPGSYVSLKLSAYPLRLTFSNDEMEKIVWEAA